MTAALPTAPTPQVEGVAAITAIAAGLATAPAPMVPATAVAVVVPDAAPAQPVSPQPAPGPPPADPVAPAQPFQPAPRPRPSAPPGGRPVQLAPTGDPSGSRTTCTAAQLRRFIKSRPWVPLHELRRRFAIAGDDDDVTPIRVGAHQLFVGLPPDEGRMLGELLGNGEIGYELALDPGAPIIVGVYPMRPVPRS